MKISDSKQKGGSSHPQCSISDKLNGKLLLGQEAVFPFHCRCPCAMCPSLYRTDGAITCERNRQIIILDNSGPFQKQAETWDLSSPNAMIPKKLPLCLPFSSIPSPLLLLSESEDTSCIPRALVGIREHPLAATLTHTPSRLCVFLFMKLF